MPINIEQIKAVADQAASIKSAADAKLAHLRECLENNIKGCMITTQEKAYGKRTGRAVYVTAEAGVLYVHFHTLKDDKTVSKVVRKVAVAEIVAVEAPQTVEG